MIKFYIKVPTRGAWLYLYNKLEKNGINNSDGWVSGRLWETHREDTAFSIIDGILTGYCFSDWYDKEGYVEIKEDIAKYKLKWL